MASGPLRILFLCTANSARSQLAEALLSARRDPRVSASSAGTRPAERVNPTAIETLRARGIDTSGLYTKTLAEAQGVEPDVVITVCDNARDECPVLPGAQLQIHWGLPDPADIVDPAARRAAFERTADTLNDRIARLLSLPLETMDRQALAAALRSLAA